MKRMLTLVVLLCATSALYAQEGNIYGGGALSFQENYWKLAPEGGYWITDQIQLGASFTIENDKRVAGLDESTVAPHVYGRYWFPITEKFGLYVGANLKVNYITQDPGNTNSVTDFYADAGIGYQIAPKWQIIGRLARFGAINNSFILDVNMTEQPLFNVGILYTIKGGNG
ncbi:porin family protein [Reichenbachiella ulvae]|uniref:Porin family protein n=1 Tax=Reichenbachiella ulvae TaxID=2980104 RepID=A0ABT3CX10_9BACT|nr:porin family protein [Reichenbachiella ulvae]MCV9388020.1 porin family protein [Reichenbachiella ulvae]